jgi:hypothetical protein
MQQPPEQPGNKLPDPNAKTDPNPAGSPRLSQAAPQPVSNDLTKQRNTTIIASVLLSLLVILVGVNGYSIASGHGLFFLAASTSTTTETPTPTYTPTLVPTQVLPTPISGYDSYTAKLWAMNYPKSAQVAEMVISYQGFPIPGTQFKFDADTSLYILESPFTIPSSQIESIFDSIAKQAPDTIVKSPPVEPLGTITYGNNTWQRETVTVTISGKDSNATILYGEHNGNAIIIAFQSSLSTFDSARQQIFIPSVSTFTFLGK